MSIPRKRVAKKNGVPAKPARVLRPRCKSVELQANEKNVERNGTGRERIQKPKKEEERRQKSVELGTGSARAKRSAN